MNNYPSVSLIISTYNWPQALKRSISSVLSQTVLPNEVIIADDGSKDDTRLLIEEFQKNFPCPLIHVWHEDDGFRLTSIRNKAIVKSSSEYIIQIDGDVILDKNFIEDHLKFAKKGCFVTSSRVILSDRLSKKIIKLEQKSLSIFMYGAGNKLNGLRCNPLTNYLRFRYKKSQPYYVKGCNMAFWRKDLIEVNGYNEDMTGWGLEDSELAIRLIMSGKKRQFLKFGGVVYHIYHKYNSRNRVSINIEIMDNAIEKRIKHCKNGLDKYLIQDIN